MPPKRNEPCPCGSGKKYKKCCLRKERDAERPSAFSHAITSAEGWLFDRDEDLIPALMLGHLVYLLGPDDSESFLHRLEELDELHGLLFESNSFDWILAEGTVDFLPEGSDLLPKGGEENQRWSEFLLGRGGVIVDYEEREWLEALAEAPLRVYEVTDCQPGEWVVLRDVLTNAEQKVNERAASREMDPGFLMATRIVKAPSEDLPRMNGLFPFDRPTYLGFRPELVRLSKSGRKATRPERMSDLIWSEWLLGFIPELPDLVDQSSGEDLVLTTHHYEVVDWRALEQALAGDPRCEGSREDSWVLFDEESDADLAGRRPIAGINPDEVRSNRLGVFAQTRSRADEAKAWLDEKAGETVRFITTELVDPLQALAAAEESNRPEPKSPLDDLDPAEVTELMQSVYEEQYSDFMDQPIPFLGDQTPREAIRSKAGRLEVEELVRSYEVGAQEEARRGGAGACELRVSLAADSGMKEGDFDLTCHDMSFFA